MPKFHFIYLKFEQYHLFYKVLLQCHNLLHKSKLSMLQFTAQIYNIDAKTYCINLHYQCYNLLHNLILLVLQFTALSMVHL